MTGAVEAAMSDADDYQFKLKVVINKQKTKVLFAEVGSNFADVLLSFLALPLGTIVRVMREHYGEEEPTIGSLTTLYDGLETLGIDRFYTTGCKELLLNPTSSFDAECRKLELDIGDTEPTKYYICENRPCASGNNLLKISTHYDIDRCDCGKSLKKRIGIDEFSKKAPADSCSGVFTRGKESFVISDDLRIVPNVDRSVVETLTSLGITDMDGAELSDVFFGFNEIMDLLKGSLLSRAPLADIIFGKGQVDSTARKYEPETLFHGMEKEVITSNSKKMIVKVMIQKSTNRLLFAQSEEDFVNFLLSLLTIPLGGVECLLGGKTCLEKIDNLYISLDNLDGDKYLRTPDTKSRLKNPKLPHGYVSKNLILPLIEEIPPQLYHCTSKKTGKNWLSYNRLWGKATEYRNGQGEYVKGPKMYMVTDDLTVTPLCMISVFHIFNEWKIPLSDVKELVLHIGLEEGLRILKALTSTSALTDGLMINPMFKKQLEQEHLSKSITTSDAKVAEIADTKEVQFSLKVMINKQKTKVLFAEIDSNFADVLLSFLALPLGTIMRVLKKHNGEETPLKIGSLTSLYNGISNLDSDHFWTEGCKKMLLNPRSSFEYECRRLKLDINDTQLNKYFCCEDLCCIHPRYSNISMHCDTLCCTCEKSLNREVGIRINSSEAAAADDDDGVFVINKESFLISDDLRMVTNMAGSVMETLRNLGITDMDGAELRIVTFGFNEIMDLLEGSLLSQTPLTDMILPYRRQMDSAVAKSEPGDFIHEMEKEATSKFKKMVLKVMVQKSTNKLLFAQSDEYFVDFLCSLLTVPLGGVEYLLGNNTCLKSIDNLYTSIADLIDDKYLANANIKKNIMKPKLPHGYMSQNQILPLSEQTDTRLYYHKGLGMDEEWLSYSAGDTETPHAIDIEYENGKGNYVNGPKMYMVRDDLTVTPLCMSSVFSVLNELKIPLSDVKQVEVYIGLQEGLSILKASLTSTSALTDGLMIKSHF